jgi:predicted HTH domain antitoxin
MSMAHETNTITIELPEGLLTHLAATPEALAKEVRVAAAIELYREGRISQGQGAQIAGMSRAEFLDELFRAKVPACQVTVDELMEELDRAVAAHRQRIPAHPVDQGGST